MVRQTSNYTIDGVNIADNGSGSADHEGNFVTTGGRMFQHRQPLRRSMSRLLWYLLVRRQADGIYNDYTIPASGGSYASIMTRTNWLV
jgi:hypothetical protein